MPKFLYTSLSDSYPDNTAFWPLDEGAGTTAHNTSLDSPGDLTLSADSWAPGLNGKDCYNPDNTYSASGGDILDIGTGDFSFSVFFKANSFPYGELPTILSKGDPAAGVAYYITTDGDTLALYLGVGGGSIVTAYLGGLSFSTGVWYQIAMITDRAAGSVEFFINGSSIGTDALSGTKFTNIQTSSNFYLGYGVYNSTPRYWDGLLQYFAFSPTRWSASDVLHFYEAYRG